jgi:hypothetical protein
MSPAGMKCHASGMEPKELAHSGSRFTDSFNEVFRSNGLKIIRTPFRVPQANGMAERFVRTVRSECFDWLMILNDHHLERVLNVFADHYNGHRPHHGLALTPPRPTRPRAAPTTERTEVHVERRDRLGGVVREFVSRRDQVSAPYTRSVFPYGLMFPIVLSSRGLKKTLRIPHCARRLRRVCSQRITVRRSRHYCDAVLTVALFRQRRHLCHAAARASSLAR